MIIIIIDMLITNQLREFKALIMKILEFLNKSLSYLLAKT